MDIGTELKEYLESNSEGRQKLLDENVVLWYIVNSFEYIIKKLNSRTDFEDKLLDRFISETLSEK